jgi:hypothetical protein
LALKIVHDNDENKKERVLKVMHLIENCFELNSVKPEEGFNAMLTLSAMLAIANEIDKGLFCMAASETFDTLVTNLEED